MANLTNIIGGQPYASAVTTAPPVTSNKLLDFWKGTQTQYEEAPLKRIGGVLAAGAPTGAVSLAFTNLTTAAGMDWNVGDTVYVSNATGYTTRTVATVTAVPLATSLTVSIAAYTSVATTGYQVDKYDPATLYLITA